MGMIYYCEKCDRSMDLDGGAGGGCQRTGCPAEGEKYCHRCADRYKPMCNHCDDGCSMCLLMHADMYKRGNKIYDCDLVWCEHKACPLMERVYDEEMCLSCFESEARKLDVGIYTKHDTWTFEECGHLVCEARQNQEKCERHECCTCKSTASFPKEQKVKKEELSKYSKDALLIKDLLEKVESNGAKSLLTSFLERHGGVVEDIDVDANVKAGTSTEKRQRTK